MKLAAEIYDFTSKILTQYDIVDKKIDFGSEIFKENVRVQWRMQREGQRGHALPPHPIFSP